MARWTLFLLFLLPLSFCQVLFWELYPGIQQWGSIIDTLKRENVSVDLYVSNYLKPLKELLNAELNYSLTSYFIKGACMSMGSFAAQAVDLAFETDDFVTRDRQYFERIIIMKMNQIWAANPSESFKLSKVFLAETVTNSITQFVLDQIATCSSADNWNQKKTFIRSKLFEWIKDNQDTPYSSWRLIIPKDFPLDSIRVHFVTGIKKYMAETSNDSKNAIIEQLSSLPCDKSPLYVNIMQMTLWLIVGISIIAVDIYSNGLPFIKDYQPI